MAVTSDIAECYRAPRRVAARLLSRGKREDMALLFVLFACILMFVAQAPYQSRLAHIDPATPVEARLYWSALIWVFLLPFGLYLFAAFCWMLCRIAGRQITGFEMRLTLFWALLAAAPLALLAGLVAAFIGPALQFQITLGLWMVAFGIFWIAGLLEANKENSVT